MYKKEITVMAKLADVNEKIADVVVNGYKKIENGVVEGYKKIEKGAVEGYKKIENGAVDGFGKVTDKCVEKMFAKEGETVEEAKKRLANGKGQ